MAQQDMDQLAGSAGSTAAFNSAVIQSSVVLPVDKPTAFTMSIQGGMLEALGINMYTTLGKCLVEFVANAFDAEAAAVEITMPVAQIDAARKSVRDAARAEAQVLAKQSGYQPASQRGKVLLLALPEDIKVSIRDTGNGMTPDQVQNAFLPVNRKRRLSAGGKEDILKTENGKRFVMGRKGLGKLAGFGAAEVVRIETKRAGQDFATAFVMRFSELAATPDLQKAELPAEYISGKQLDEHYTLIELYGLKCDAVRNGVASIRDTIAEAFFGILPAEFSISVNGEVVLPEPVTYEFQHPNGSAVGSDGFVETTISVDELIEPLTYKYMVSFRPSGSHLPAAKRGARIYCNNRLAAGPTLLDLPTGMHNFHAQSYMECVVIANDLDRFGVDIINTNRTHLRQDSELVERFLAAITASMVVAINAHSAFRDKKADADIAENDKARMLAEVASQLPQRTRTPIRKLLTSMAARFGVESREFSEIAPLVIGAANAGEVLIKLIEAQANPRSIEVVAGHLRDLAEIEKSDALKLYRGRRSAILALAKLEQEGEDLWRAKGFELKLHELFKKEPWLIKPEFARPIVSDEDLTKLASKLAKLIGVDRFTPPQKDGKDDKDRPDLCFVMCDSHTPSVITIVELKSPSLPLDATHKFQLTEYMRKIEAFLEVELHSRQWAVHGILVGALPDPKTTSESCQSLLHSIRRRGISESWEVLGIRQLIQHAQAIHQAAIDVMESEQPDADDDGQ